MSRNFNMIIEGNNILSDNLPQAELRKSKINFLYFFDMPIIHCFKSTKRSLAEESRILLSILLTIPNGQYI